jgi:RNA polymerase-binding transcription factor DksA
MPGWSGEALRVELLAKKKELTTRLERITANVQRGFNADSKEMAKELEDSEVVDALELVKISAAIQRLDNGRYGICTECMEPIEVNRIKAYPYADECIECASFDERRRARL